MIALPQHTPSDIGTLQRIDPVTSEILVFWEQKRRPNQEKRKQLTQSALVLLRGTVWLRGTGSCTPRSYVQVVQRQYFKYCYLLP